MADTSITMSDPAQVSITDPSTVTITDPSSVSAQEPSPASPSDLDPFALKLPSKYAPKKQPAAAAADAAADGEEASEATEPSSPSPQPAPPSLEWLSRTWTVTHSTLAMWRAARNVRITYKPLAAKPDGRMRVDDLVEYEPSNKTGVVKTVTGVDTQSARGDGWDWRGKGLLFFVEKWAVTWFAPTLFTKEGLDVYCDRQEGLSDETYNRIEEALKNLEAKELVDMVTQDMMPVDISLPWAEK
ncbi:hypothetical protein PT974_02603 [Cladobotryum mycophilum]|uniref:Uncharacterized protein n=1 Tax=Cladobotryum mycophilum TaxID=491253 RepID=A0ABR0SZ26_9HYPO